MPLPPSLHAVLMGMVVVEEEVVADEDAVLAQTLLSISKSPLRISTSRAAMPSLIKLLCLLGLEVSTEPLPASPAVLWFMKSIVERMEKDALELYFFYKDAQDVYEARNRQVERSSTRG